MNLITISIVIHIIFLLSIFDIYFKSPIINNISSCEIKSKAPAKRLVLIVADGLRAESLFQNKETAFSEIETVAPFLSSICKSKGSWGISHTRVPTESRPGHVALAAGFYEDPSAVAKGWKENMVEFDSIFNKSTYSWTWGSPDIVPMFAKGSAQNNVFIDYYNAEIEDFSGKNSTTLLDLWVFNKVEHFFKKALTDENLLDKLNKDKIVFFMHLLGLDSAGHTHKPKSKEHFENIVVVDNGIKQMENLFETFYKDGKTAYVFTADHGMTDWGSHGTGSKHETETPFITWGAGIKRNTDPIDINQADITPLMAILIGVPIPVNSVGVLPTNYLNMSDKDISYAIFSNSRQIATQFIEKQLRTKKDTWKSLYYPFSELDDKKVEAFYTLIEEKINKHEYENAIKLSKNLITISLKGLDYYQNYYQKMLLTCTTFSYIGWILLLLLNILNKPIEHIELYQKQNVLEMISYEYKINKNIHVFFGILMFIVISLSYTQNFPFMFYVHFILPVLLWWTVTVNYRCFIPKLWHEWKVKNTKLEYIFWIIFYIIGIEILVLCFFERKILTLSLIGISLWPYLTKIREITFPVKFSWMISCIILSIFPMLPVVGSSYHINMILVGSVCWLFMNLLTIYGKNYFIKKVFYIDYKQKLLLCILSIFLLITIINIYAIEQSFQQKNGLPGINQLVSWCLFMLLPFIPMVGCLRISNRLLNLNFSLSIPIILLSVNYEPIFNFLLFINLFIWMIAEYQLSNKEIFKLSTIHFVQHNSQHMIGEEKVTSSLVKPSDFRRAYFFVLYILLAFFGTGNMASLNAFDPLWVRNFLTIFSPFTMAGLILFKIVIPFLTVSCIFRAITVVVKAPVRKLFLIVLMIGDIMGLHFLYLVKNQGSWLEIGMTISHFVIVQSIVVFIIIFYLLSIVLTETGVKFDKNLKMY